MAGEEKDLREFYTEQELAAFGGNPPDWLTTAKQVARESAKKASRLGDRDALPSTKVEALTE